MITINELKYTPEDLDLSKFEDGLYTFTFKILNGEVEETFTKSVFLTCKLEQCVDKLACSINFDKCDCNCTNDKKEKLFLLKGMLVALRCAIKIENYIRATTILKKASDLCLTTNCKAC